jgi:hypothetical protein
MAWQENLFSNLLVISILLGLTIMIYCKIAKKTLTELIIEIREAFSSPIEE